LLTLKQFPNISYARKGTDETSYETVGDMPNEGDDLTEQKKLYEKRKDTHLVNLTKRELASWGINKPVFYQTDRDKMERLFKEIEIMFLWAVASSSFT